MENIGAGQRPDQRLDVKQWETVEAYRFSR